MSNHRRPLVLLDTSGSMGELAGARRRIDVLAAVLQQVLPGAPGARLFAFDSIVRELDGASRLPEPAGGTALHVALGALAPLQPQLVIIVSDGEPDDAEAALAAARDLHCQIATHFVGDERDHAAVAFVRALAWCSTDGMGQTAICDLRRPERLAHNLRRLLTGPAME